MNMHEPLTGLFHSSRLMILNFADIPADTPPVENLQRFFEDCEKRGLNPRLPENRQKFNNHLLERSRVRYLVSRYGEDRKGMLTGSKIASQGRTLHMGVDIFCRDLETVYAPCDAAIVRTGREPGDQGYGYYVVLKPDNLPGIHFFFGQLSKDLPGVGPIKAGQPIARLGDFIHGENGGWSRHLHLQMVKTIPREPDPPAL